MKKKNHLEEPLLFLGTGREYLIFRKKVKDELIAKGYKNIIIMEEVEDKDDKSLDSKFDRIINENKPSLIFAFFQMGARTDGITFEIGWLCGRYNGSELARKLRILHEYGYNWDDTTDIFVVFLLVFLIFL